MGKIFLTYSACPADTPDYRLGMLVAPVTANPIDPQSWVQIPGPVFARERPGRGLRAGPSWLLPFPRRERGLDRVPRQDGDG